MKKTTISLAALAVSASSFAFIHPGMGQVETKTYCLSTYTDESGNMSAGTCDQSENNIRGQLPVNQDGCAEGQIALTTSRRADQAQFPINIRMCLPPNIAQL